MSYGNMQLAIEPEAERIDDSSCQALEFAVTLATDLFSRRPNATWRTPRVARKG